MVGLTGLIRHTAQMVWREAKELDSFDNDLIAEHDPEAAHFIMAAQRRRRWLLGALPPTALPRLAIAYATTGFVALVAGIVALILWLLPGGTGYQATAVAIIVAAGVVVLFTGGASYVARILYRRRLRWETEFAQSDQPVAQKATSRDRDSPPQEQAYAQFLAGAERLTSSSPLARLAGVYALESLADAYETQRSHAVGMLCAYLRMPFTPAARAADVDEVSHGLVEQQIRVTIENLISRHVKSSLDDTQLFWGDVELDLTGATLVALNLAHCQIRLARFDRTTWTHSADFKSAKFIEQVSFAGAQFVQDAQFRETAFMGSANFAGAQFDDSAEFTYAPIGGASQPADLILLGARFLGPADFGTVSVSGHLLADGARFADTVSFARASVAGRAYFHGVQFGAGLSATGARFGDEADFRKAHFLGPVYFTDLHASSTVVLRDAEFADVVWFTHPEGASTTAAGLDTMSGTAPLTLYLDDGDRPGTVEVALMGVLTDLGWSVVGQEPPIVGSWLHRFTARTKALSETETGERLLRELNRAMELRTVDKLQAEVDSSQASAVSGLLLALKDQANALIQIGSILLVKVDGVPIVRNLTPLELEHLRRNPSLSGRPAECLSALQALVDRSRPELPATPRDPSTTEPEAEKAESS